ncbi:MAG TPA: hypothetical protein VFR21_21690 [Bradyrhizobium sp.]|nr:hypothetical protein [Bradyrhizobium sp.]
MVLDAVARIEQALAAQQRLQQQHEIQAAEQSALPEALAAIRNAIIGAEAAAATALHGLALEQNLTPIRKGVRIIREISWRWREIGADSRICDLIDSQVVAFEAACDQLAGADPRAALIAAFDMIRAELDSHDEAVAAAPLEGGKIEASATGMAGVAEASVPETVSAPVNAETARPVEDIVATGAAAQVEAPIAATTASAPAAKSQAAAPVESVAATSASPTTEANVTRVSVTTDIVAEAPVPAAPGRPVGTTPEPVQVLDEPVKVAAAPAQAMGERPVMADQFALSVTDDDDLDIIVVSKAEADAQDEALLELVAAEMGAPDPVEAKEFGTSSSIHFEIEDPGSVDDDIVATFVEPPAPDSKPEQPSVAAAAPPSPAPPPRQAPAPEPLPVAAAKPEPVVPAPAPVAPPPVRLAQVPIALMHEPVKATPVVQEQPKPAPIVQELPKLAPVVQEQPKPVAPTAMVHPLPKPIPQPSLGATLLANGLLKRPVAANDPLTPIRRMTQPEKIAFFS